jgi:hypothetical protein
MSRRSDFSQIALHFHTQQNPQSMNHAAAAIERLSPAQTISHFQGVGNQLSMGRGTSSSTNLLEIALDCRPHTHHKACGSWILTNQRRRTSISHDR